MWHEPVTLDRVLDFPVVTTQMQYTRNNALEAIDIPAALNEFFVSLADKIAKFCHFPLSVKSEWGKEWYNNGVCMELIPGRSTFCVSVHENMFFRQSIFFWSKFVRQADLRINAHYIPNLKELHVYFRCPADHELGSQVIKDFIASHPNLNIPHLVFYLFKDRLPQGESTATCNTESLERVSFSHN